MRALCDAGRGASFRVFYPIHGETKEEQIWLLSFKNSRRVRENATRECRKPRQTRGIRWALVLSVSSLDIQHDDAIPTRGGRKSANRISQIKLIS